MQPNPLVKRDRLPAFRLLAASYPNVKAADEKTVLPNGQANIVCGFYQRLSLCSACMWPNHRVGYFAQCRMAC